jgi:hypothetical protein
MHEIPIHRLIKQISSSIFILIMNVKGFFMNAKDCQSVNPNSNFSMNLQHQAMFSVPDASKVRIGVAEGSVWITLDNDSKDYVLDACEVFTTAEHRRALVYALKPSCITVSERLPSRSAVSTHHPKGAQHAITLYPGALHSPC